MVVLDDVFDPLVAAQITATLRFWLMTGSSLGNVDLGEILFTFQNIDEFPEVWVICSYIGKIMEDFNTKCYVMNNEEELFQ